MISARITNLEVLIRKLCSVDALAARAVALREVTALQHELGDDSVEDRAYKNLFQLFLQHFQQQHRNNV